MECLLPDCLAGVCVRNTTGKKYARQNVGKYIWLRLGRIDDGDRVSSEFISCYIYSFASVSVANYITYPHFKMNFWLAQYLARNQLWLF